MNYSYLFKSQILEFVKYAIDFELDNFEVTYADDAVTFSLERDLQDYCIVGNVEEGDVVEWYWMVIDNTGNHKNDLYSENCYSSWQDALEEMSRS